jgi:hypothetical protein
MRKQLMEQKRKEGMSQQQETSEPGVDRASGYTNGAWPASSHEEVTPTQSHPPLMMKFASCGLTDDALDQHCKDVLTSFAIGSQRRLERIDISGNRVTESGFSALVDFLCTEQIVTTHLHLDGNVDLLFADKTKSADALLKIMSDRWAGIGAGLHEMHLGLSQLPQASCWKLCQSAYAESGKTRLRPALRLCLHYRCDDKNEELVNKGGALLDVFRAAEEKQGVKIAGLASLAKSCRESSPMESPEESESVLAVVLVGDVAESSYFDGKSYQ